VLADREQAKRALTVASVLIVVAVGFFGYLSGTLLDRCVKHLIE
jgi:hypothetical protein